MLFAKGDGLSMLSGGCHHCGAQEVTSELKGSQWENWCPNCNQLWYDKAELETDPATIIRVASEKGLLSGMAKAELEEFCWYAPDMIDWQKTAEEYGVYKS